MLIQEKQVRGRLRDDFEPLIDITDIQHHPQPTMDEMRTSRALAALCIAARAKADPQDAAKCVVDESGDRGIDAVGVSHTDETVYIVQAKAGGGTPSLTDVQKLISGIQLLLNSDWTQLGPKLQAHRSTIEQSLEYPNARVVAIFSYLGKRSQTQRWKLNQPGLRTMSIQLARYLISNIQIFAEISTIGMSHRAKRPSMQICNSKRSGLFKERNRFGRQPTSEPLVQD